MQQVLAYETDLLEFEDIFEGSAVIEAKVAALIAGAKAELETIERMGGAVACVPYMKERLVASNARRVAGIESGAQKVVGVNCFTQSEDSPLSAGEGLIVKVDPRVEFEQIERLKAWRSRRDHAAVAAAIGDLEACAREGRNIMPASIAAAKAGVTTGEWGAALRAAFGEYRGPTGVAIVVAGGDDPEEAAVRAQVAALSEKLGEAFRFLVGKPGLDGHSNGAEQIATRARAVGMEVIYEGIRSSPAEIVASAKAHKAHAIGLSILSGSHLDLVQEIVRLMRADGLDHVPLVVGGIIPPADENVLKQMGVAKVYTPKDFKLNGIMGEIVGVVAARLDA
jgi:(2R)-ethylmalonyl-CoA mutase